MGDIITLDFLLYIAGAVITLVSATKVISSVLQNTIKKTIEDYDKECAETKSKTKQDIVNLRADVDNIKQDVVELRQDVDTLKENMKDVKQDIKETRQDIQDIRKDIKYLTEFMKEFMIEVREFNTKMTRLVLILSRWQINKIYEEYEGKDTIELSVITMVNEVYELYSSFGGNGLISREVQELNKKKVISS